MKVIAEIAKSTYELTFDSKAEYKWLNIGQLFIESDDVYEELTSKALITYNESKEDILYWQDMFFMELAEQSHELNNDEPLIRKLKAHPLFKSNQNFLNQLPKASSETGREMLIDEMIDNKDADQLIPDELIEDVLKKKSRDELRENFEEWSAESNEIGGVAYLKTSESSEKSKYSYVNYLAVAAILIIGFFIWQPTQSTDKELFAYYSTNLQSITRNNFEKLNKEVLTSNERGEDFILNNYSKVETDKALSGLSHYKDGNYDRAKKIFKELNPKNRNKQILYFLAISQLNTNDVDSAISNLEYLIVQPNFNFINEAKFHLAIGYLKRGFRKKSKELLKELIKVDSEISKEANYILKQMRWF